jgi:hypothetical protein
VTALCALAAATRADGPSDDLVILPEEVVLRGAGTRHQLLVEARDGGAFVADLTIDAQFSSSNPVVATVDEQGVVTARADGRTMITARTKDRTATTVVRVEHAYVPYPISFRNHVLPVMTKAGCNSGACHGAAAGKNGFKLTLRGYDPELDYLTLSRQAVARRINKVEPAHSLMLLKPTLAVSHGGGKRFAPGSPEYGTLLQWIAAGMPAPGEWDPALTRLEVLPARVRLQSGERQQVLVRGHFSDGHVEDVTRWAKFSSTDDGIASVDERGRVTSEGPGEAAISIWYLSRVAASRVTTPFLNATDPAVYRRAARHNFVDDHVLKKLEELAIEPSALSSDSEFIRRASLDAAGILPRADEVRRFLDDRSPDKRRRLIDALLDRAEFVDYWAYKWSDLLLVSSRKVDRAAMWAYYGWVRSSVAENKPWDRMVRELITASGNTLSHGAANYYVIHKNPIELAENVSLAFMGFSITCARCHNHPLEKWTQRDYYQMANLFSRVGLKNGASRGDIVVYTTASGEINHPRLNVPLPPRPLDGAELPLDAPIDRRKFFADWLTSPENPFFARAVVNRVWKSLMGRGLVEAVDDIREPNPPSNPDLFAALTRDFVDHGFDLKHLVRTIMRSSTYQLTSAPTESNRADLTYHSHYIARRLPAEVMLDAISQVTGVPETFSGYPEGTRALQLPDTAIDSYFLDAFGRPPRLVSVDSERQQEPSIAQALHVINGETINTKLRAPEGIIQTLLDSGADHRAAIETIYLLALSRYPTSEELETLSRELDERARTALAVTAAEAEAQTNGSTSLQARRVDEAEASYRQQARRQALEDLAWAVLTGKEFLFNH